ncbi:MAG: 50S ribosomal protein L21 [Microscillaceae bacterium]|nr:50S ribosomal protein L21 [Microscillaceae bacterium]MDW8461274.1 50S ribosomal protein L21 [Cytophagales bacterium]
MYAIVEIAGQQFKVENNKYIYTHRLDAEEGAELTFDKVLLIDNDGSVSVGKPTVAGAKISAKVMKHLRGEKIIVFKKKRRKGYKKTIGHRQELTKLMIENIVF